MAQGDKAYKPTNLQTAGAGNANESGRSPLLSIYIWLIDDDRATHQEGEGEDGGQEHPRDAFALGGKDIVCSRGTGGPGSGQAE